MDVSTTSTDDTGAARESLQPQDTRFPGTLLKEVFRHCDVDLLKTIRVVCKEWSTVALHSWRERAVMRIYDSTNPEYKDGATLERLNDILLANDHAFRLHQFPFRRIIIDYTDKYLSPAGSATLWTQDPFLQQCWATMTHLEAYISDFKQVLTNVLPMVPNLRRLGLVDPTLWGFDEYVDEPLQLHENLTVLKLVFLDINKIADEYQLKQGWKRVLEVCKNLQKIELEPKVDWDYEEKIVSSLLNSIRIVKDEGRHANPEALNAINVSVDGIGIDLTHYAGAILESGLKPDIIRLEGDLEARISEENARIFETIRPNLTALIDFRYPPTFHFDLFPSVCKQLCNRSLRGDLAAETMIQLPALKRYFTCTGSLFCAIYALCRLKADNLATVTIAMRQYEDPITTEEYLKGACRLDFLYSTNANIIDQFMQNLLLPSVSEFEYANLSIAFGSAMIRRLAQCMPNLKHLKMPFNVATISTIWEATSWPNLESLTVLTTQQNADSWTDTHFVGIETNTENGGERARKGIQNLQYLRTFVFGPEAEETDDVLINAHLTDVSAREGFLKLPCLTTLQFPFTKLSDECRSELKKHIRILID